MVTPADSTYLIIMYQGIWCLSTNKDSKKRFRLCYFISLFSIRFFTTSGSARVLVSPKLSISFIAIFLKIRRIILPDLVFGNPDAH